MKLYTDNDGADRCAGKYLLLDNDFLSELYRDEESFLEFLEKFKRAILLLIL